MNIEGHVVVLDTNACGNCRRPIELVKGIGWLHAELPQYAHEAITCDRAVPVDPRCPVCDSLVPGVPVADGGVHLTLHYPKTGLPCHGSGYVVPRPA